jgi:hypothetical protein
MNELETATQPRRLLGIVGNQPHRLKHDTTILTAMFRTADGTIHEDLEINSDLLMFVKPLCDALAGGEHHEVVAHWALQRLSSLEANCSAEADKAFAHELRSLMTRLTLVDP